MPPWVNEAEGSTWSSGGEKVGLAEFPCWTLETWHGSVPYVLGTRGSPSG